MNSRRWSVESPPMGVASRSASMDPAAKAKELLSRFSRPSSSGSGHSATRSRLARRPIRLDDDEEEEEEEEDEDEADELGSHAGSEEIEFEEGNPRNPPASMTPPVSLRPSPQPTASLVSAPGPGSVTLSTMPPQQRHMQIELGPIGSFRPAITVPSVRIDSPDSDVSISIDESPRPAASPPHVPIEFSTHPIASQPLSVQRPSSQAPSDVALSRGSSIASASPQIATRPMVIPTSPTEQDRRAGHRPGSAHSHSGGDDSASVSVVGTDVAEEDIEFSDQDLEALMARQPHTGPPRVDLARIPPTRVLANTNISVTAAAAAAVAAVRVPPVSSQLAPPSGVASDDTEIEFSDSDDRPSSPTVQPPKPQLPLNRHGSTHSPDADESIVIEVDEDPEPAPVSTAPLSSSTTMSARLPPLPPSAAGLISRTTLPVMPRQSTPAVKPVLAPLPAAASTPALVKPQQKAVAPAPVLVPVPVPAQEVIEIEVEEEEELSGPAVLPPHQRLAPAVSAVSPPGLSTTQRSSSAPLVVPPAPSSTSMTSIPEEDDQNPPAPLTITLNSSTKPLSLPNTQKVPVPPTHGRPDDDDTSYGSELFEDSGAASLVLTPKAQPLRAAGTVSTPSAPSLARPPTVTTKHAASDPIRSHTDEERKQPVAFPDSCDAAVQTELDPISVQPPRPIAAWPPQPAHAGMPSPIDPIQVALSSQTALAWLAPSYIQLQHQLQQQQLLIHQLLQRTAQPQSQQSHDPSPSAPPPLHNMPLFQPPMPLNPLMPFPLYANQWQPPTTESAPSQSLIPPTVFHKQMAEIMESVESCRKLLSAHSAHLPARRYTTLQDTEKFLSQHRRAPLSLEAALRKLELQDNLR